jgi:hypothetical protein
MLNDFGFAKTTTVRNANQIYLPTSTGNREPAIQVFVSCRNLNLRQAQFTIDD